jgi:probable rRNA maturation factor
VAEELELLCTHGILHLLGYDHADPEEHATMFGLQDRLLSAWRAGHGRGRDPRAPDESG